jgi:N-acetylglucosamine-6-phosphate deacetylase
VTQASVVMPSALWSEKPINHITKLTNCRLLQGEELVQKDLWISSATGKILNSQETFYDDHVLPDQTIDLGNRIVSPGLIDVQFNGAYGFNFSTLPEHPSDYVKSLRDLSRKLVQTGVTSFVPTLTSQTSTLYRAVLPYLGPSGKSRRAEDGAESLGSHIEGPFLNPGKHGVHSVEVLRTAERIEDLDEMYGADNLNPDLVKYVTVAPEQGTMTKIIPELRRRGIIVSIGHSEATYEEASTAVQAGATMITHLFNAMRGFSHRGPGIFGVLGSTDERLGHVRPYFGIIADGIHLHPTTVKIAFNAHPDGFILVTDAMHLMGLPDGSYEWTNGNETNHMVKKGFVLLLEGTETIAGR